MSNQIEYGRRLIDLFYSKGDIDYTKFKMAVEGVGKNSLENYEIAEQEAWLYLLRNASAKKPHRKLEKIIKITLNTFSDEKDENIIKVVLTGVAVFEKD